MTQKEAALEAVRQVGINQIAEIEPEWFVGREQEYEMLQRRLELLKQNEIIKLPFEDLLNRMTQAARDILGKP